MTQLQTAIEAAFEHRTDLAPGKADKATVEAVTQALTLLDTGQARVAEKLDGQWTVHEWLKKAVLLSFRLRDNTVIEGAYTHYFDKIPLKYADYTPDDFQRDGARIVPPAMVRQGAYVAPDAVLMPSYVNIGAYVGEGTMVDTWATVGSCAQIGRNVHLAGGVGIGGVLEPPGARPVFVEDDAFCGSRCVITEGTIVEEAAVLGAGVVLTGSVPVIDVTGDEPVTRKGRVPARAIVIPGSREKAFPAGTYHIPCALIIGYRSDATDTKVSLNDALRDHDVAV
jgi:2,3,4,5-tetrahydropyridine-2-carboxylate N-succinyltransferase